MGESTFFKFKKSEVQARIEQIDEAMKKKEHSVNFKEDERDKILYFLDPFRREKIANEGLPKLAPSEGRKNLEKKLNDIVNKPEKFSLLPGLVSLRG